MNARPPTYLDHLPRPMWFWMEFGLGMQVVLPLWTARHLRIRLCESQNWRCCYCGKTVTVEDPVSAPSYATFEHVHRRTAGGGDDRDNLVIACHLCNTSRADADPYTYAGPRPRVRFPLETSCPPT